MLAAALIGKIKAMSDTDLGALRDALNTEFRNRQNAIKFELRYGDKVSFDASERGFGTVVMRVQRINPKTISGIQLSPERGKGTKWRVHPSFLTKLNDAPRTSDGDAW